MTTKAGKIKDMSKRTIYIFGGVIELQQVKAGIDAGGTLLKIAYQENGAKHYRKYPIGEMESAISWLKMMAPDLGVALTGGKAHIVQQKFFPDGLMVPEFQATCEGARLLLLEEGKKLDAPFIIVNVGTGTSWHLVNGEKYERILGSGMGGGTFMGLGALLTNEANYEKFTELAASGQKGNLDLLVKDIYESDQAPINGDLTAANFAKGLSVKHSPADRMAALANMIAETIMLLTLQAAAIHKVKEVVFIGSSLIDNPLLKGTLNNYMTMLSLDAIFLKNGEYCGALGAFLSV
ncbi:type II pantothenate kinase [Bacillus sp. FJAT-29814]|uniref:type II pantothenate kinase n=1 Tax=Bacillus sp. FJAT-29814 TaxID=1729688 RepID=UPI000AEAAA30|nr:type II pantothenate kinase [Bacillus sp. FJAT-29814]